MGWTTTPGAKRRDVIAERTANYEDTSQRRECLAHAVRGKILWTVWEITSKRDGRTQRYIGCDILGTDGEGNHGYKDECESVGPIYYSCPLKFLKMVPEVACEGWRAKVREFHARAGQKIVVGQTLKLVNASIPSVTVTSVRPLRGTYLGQTYRIPRRFLAPPEEQETAQTPKHVATTSGDKQTTLFAA
jgi:hypothetical protein